MITVGGETLEHRVPNSSPTTHPPKMNAATNARAPMFTGSTMASTNTTTSTRIDKSSIGMRRPS